MKSNTLSVLMLILALAMFACTAAFFLWYLFAESGLERWHLFVQAKLSAILGFLACMTSMLAKKPE